MTFKIFFRKSLVKIAPENPEKLDLEFGISYKNKNEPLNVGVPSPQAILSCDIFAFDLKFFLFDFFFLCCVLGILYFRNVPRASLNLLFRLKKYNKKVAM